MSVKELVNEGSKQEEVSFKNYYFIESYKYIHNASRRYEQYLSTNI